MTTITSSPVAKQKQKSKKKKEKEAGGSSGEALLTRTVLYINVSYRPGKEIVVFNRENEFSVFRNVAVVEKKKKKERGREKEKE